MKNTLVISGQRNYTLLTIDIDSCDIDFSQYNRSVFYRILERICWIFNLPFFYFFFPFMNRKIEKYKNIILFECHYPVEVVKYIRKRNTNCNLIYWCWNSIDKIHIGKGYALANEIKKLAELQKKIKVKVASFDMNDCDKYKLIYNNQLGVNMLSRNLSNQVNNEYDVFFCGKDKDRINVIKNLDKIFCQQGINMKCMLLPDDNKEYSLCDKNRYLINCEMDYVNMIKEELKSKCILEIVQNGQNGLTWRPLESLFYKKKLITNYSAIKYQKFYCKENVFILGEDDIDKLYCFINSPYKDISNKLIKHYLWNDWMRKLIEV